MTVILCCSVALYVCKHNAQIVSRCLTLEHTQLWTVGELSYFYQLC